MPPPEVMTCLPNHEQLLPLLLQYDVVGFQTDGDAGNFVRYLITESRNSHSEMTVFESSGWQITFPRLWSQSFNWAVGCSNRETGTLS